MRNQFVIKNVYRDELLSNDKSCPYVKFTVITDRGEDEFLEWITNGQCESTDSHIQINEIDKLSDLFDLSEKPDLMPCQDYLPLPEIYSQVNEILRLILE